MTQVRAPSPQTETVRPRTDNHPPQEGGREGRSPVPNNPTGDEGKKERQITLLWDHVNALRRERDRKEATLLNHHIYKVSRERAHDDALEVIREATMEEYGQLLERELQPMLDYFELIDEQLIDVIPLEEEEDPNFDYPGIMTGKRATICGFCSRFRNTLLIGRYGMECTASWGTHSPNAGTGTDRQ